MNQSLLRQSLEREAKFSFARSGGPGGQNVNKVNTKVFISIKLSLLEGLSYYDFERISNKLEKKIDADGNLSISVEDERSQFRNREIALDRIESTILRANHQDKKRIPTKPGKAAKLRRLGSKHLRSHTKANRGKPTSDD